MTYRQMIQDARDNGIATEAHMYNAIDRIDVLLSHLKVSHPDIYWEFMRQSHEDLYGPHYDAAYADYDVSLIHYTSRDGIEHHGAHWSLTQVLAATASKTFPEGTTDHDKYVAYNATYADLCRKFSEPEILEAAYLYYFADEDAPEGKIWHYMNSMRPRRTA